MAYQLLLILFTVVFSLIARASESCAPRSDLFSLKPLNDFVKKSCEDTKASKKCQDLYATMRKNGEKPEEKGLQCKDRNTVLRILEADIDFKVGCATGGWEYAIDTFKTMGTAIGEGLAKVVVDVQKAKTENEICDKDPAKKQALYIDHNNNVPKMLRIDLPPEGIFKRVDCARLKVGLKLAQDQQAFKAMDRVRGRLSDPKAKYNTEEQEYVDWLKSMSGKGGRFPNLIDLAKTKLREMGVRLECYNTREAAALTCEAIADVASLAAGPAGVVLKASRASKIAKLAGISLEDAKRIEAAAKAVGRDLSPVQKSAVIKAHEVGIAEGRGYRLQGGLAGEYTKADLKKKSEILKSADFTQTERRILMEKGITGQPIPNTGKADQSFIPDFNEAMSRRNTEVVNAAAAEGATYYRVKVTSSATEFKKAFPENDLTGLLQANYFGASTDDAAKLAEKYFEVHGYDPNYGKLSVISQLRQETRYYETSGIKVDPNIASYRVYKNKELEYKLWKDYYESRYSDKYHNLDYDRLSDAQRNQLEKLKEELKNLRERARKNKWPGS